MGGNKMEKLGLIYSERSRLVVLWSPTENCCDDGKIHNYTSVFILSLNSLFSKVIYLF